MAWVAGITFGYFLIGILVAFPILFWRTKYKRCNFQNNIFLFYLGEGDICDIIVAWPFFIMVYVIALSMWLTKKSMATCISWLIEKSEQKSKKERHIILKHEEWQCMWCGKKNIDETRVTCIHCGLRRSILMPLYEYHEDVSDRF